MKCIYAIINKVNSKRYLGSAVDFKRRTSRHFSELRCNKHHSLPLQRAFDKYGEDMFEFIVLEKVENKEDLIPREQWWLDNTNCEYNVCKIAGSLLGTKRSEETKRKIGESTKRYLSNNPHPMKGRLVTDETRDKISKGRRGIGHTEEAKKKIGDASRGSNNPNYGKPLSDEVKLKKSIAMKEYFKTHPHMNAARVGKYSLTGELVIIYNSIKEASNNEGVSPTTIKNWIMGKHKPWKVEFEYKHID